MRYACVLIYIVLLAVACKKDAPNYSTRFTILNAVPDAQGFDVYAGGGKINAGLAFGNPDYYLPVAAISDSVKWKLTNHSNFDSAFMTDLPNGNDFTLLFFDSASRYQSYLIKDNWQQPASPKQGYARFFPMIIGGDSLRITNDTNKVLIGPRSFADFKSGLGAFTAIDSFATKLRLYNKKVLLDSLPGAVLLPGKSYTIYAVGILNATGDKRPRMIWQEHQ